MMLDEDRAIAPLLVSAFNESNPAVSPDGAWIAYRSDESGRNGVYVERFPDMLPAAFLGGRPRDARRAHRLKSWPACWPTSATT